MLAFVLAAAILAADPSGPPETQSTEKLLRTFRDEFVHIQPGEGPFPVRSMAGRNSADRSEGPVHQLRIAYDFYMAAYEVPQNLYEAVMGNNPSRWVGPRNAVEMISYEDAVEFCRRVTTMLRELDLIAETQVVRLPSEAEWEYCARAGSDRLYCFGDDPEELDKYAWYQGNASGNDPPVGAKLPNAWGLYDMHGYLWEWCSDYWHSSHAGATGDGTPRRVRGDPRRRAVRGGSWKDPAERLYCCSRRSAFTTTRDDALGMRCVLADATTEQ